MVHPAILSMMLASSLLGTASASSPARPASRPAAGTVMIFPPAAVEGQESFAKAVAYSIYRKIKRAEGWEVVDPMTVEDAVAASPQPVGPDTPLADLLALCRRFADADFAIVGRVARGDGESRTGELRVVDLNAGPPAEVSRHVFAVAEPHQLRGEIDKILMNLTGLSPYHRSLPPSAEARWRSGPNLVPNPDMEAGDKTLARWEGQIADQRFNPPRLDATEAPIQGEYRRMIWWAAAPDGGRCVHFAMDSNVAATYGLACYSDWIPIQEGATYRFSCRYRSTGPTIKVFVKAYAAFDAKDGTGTQRREIYRRQIHPKGPLNEWNTTVADLVPRHDKARLQWIRVDLYAYWPEGRVWFDDVVLKRIADPAPEPEIDPGRKQLGDSQERLIREQD